MSGFLADLALGGIAALVLLIYLVRALIGAENL